ncbi:hypothetical protein ACLOJK_039885 [Asimina triloba]
MMQNPLFNQLDSLSEDSIVEILQSWSGYCACATQIVLKGGPNLYAKSDFVSTVNLLCKYGLDSLVQDHFLQETFRENAVARFWQRFDSYHNVAALEIEKRLGDWVQMLLPESLKEICSERQYQENCLLILGDAIQSYKESVLPESKNLEIPVDGIFSSSHDPSSAFSW